MSMMHISRRSFLTSSAVMAGLSSPLAVFSRDAWPTKPVKFVVTVTPGGSPDIVARAFAQYWSSVLPQPVTVENRPGGMGMIAMQYVATSPPDGHTISIGVHSQVAQAPIMLKRPAVDVNRDLKPVAAFYTGASPACVHKDFPAKTMREVVEIAKKRVVNVGNYSLASTWQLMLTEIMRETGAKFNIVTYKGTGQMLQDLMSGVLDMGAGSLGGMMPGIDSGRIRPIVIITNLKSDKLPGVPIWADEGFKGPVFNDLRETNLLQVPAQTPQWIVDRQVELLKEGVEKSEAVRAAFNSLGLTSDYMFSGAALDDMIKVYRPTIQRLTKELNLTPQ
ncbi:MAG: tripartite tricarboxylate transporter substrate binding protein [Proteobacteria bacterium]|nr:tripartite tricarboxylate transporter substrate binding protein [Pseudomonadota bacterium]MBS0492744.1 tripartite tricarboxylate transporter substrate binding protein [Pseudomonadota bacterium]